MNLYDKDDGFRCFTLEEANGVLPEIINITKETVRRLDEAKRNFESEKIINEVFAEDQFDTESAIILQKWAEDIVDLGGYPKGYFTVDFKSPIPDTLFCWSYGEKLISYTHKVYESFKDRIPIHDKGMPGFEQSLN
ncbi:MAG: DUF2203 family protein [bacterium]